MQGFACSRPLAASKFAAAIHSMSQIGSSSCPRVERLYLVVSDPSKPSWRVEHLVHSGWVKHVYHPRSTLIMPTPSAGRCREHCWLPIGIHRFPPEDCPARRSKVLGRFGVMTLAETVRVSRLGLAIMGCVLRLKWRLPEARSRGW